MGHLNNSGRRGESVVTSAHSPFLLSPQVSVPRGGRGAARGNNTSQVCNHIFTCWHNSSEKVTSCQVWCFQPCSPSHLPARPLATHLSSLRLMESRSIRFGDLSELVKVGRLRRTWKGASVVSAGRRRRREDEKGRGGKDNTDDQRTLS